MRTYISILRQLTNSILFLLLEHVILLLFCIISINKCDVNTLHVSTCRVCISKINATQHTERLSQDCLPAWVSPRECQHSDRIMLPNFSGCLIITNFKFLFSKWDKLFKVRTRVHTFSFHNYKNYMKDNCVLILVLNINL